jgi:hexosaminidase
MRTLAGNTSCGGGVSSRRSDCIVLSISLIFLAYQASPCVALYAEHKIWPAASQTELYSEPSSIVLRTAKPLSPSDWTFEHVFDNNHHAEDADFILVQAENRFVATLQRLPDHAQPENFPVNPSNKELWPVQGVRIHITATSAADDAKTTTLRHGVDESYSLEVPPVIDAAPFVLLQAPTVYGALHGLQTLFQLFSFGWLDDPEDDGTAVYLLLDAPIQIVDAPQYPYRGLLIDTSRHYLPESIILQNLDAMAMTKLNVLHWHMTDSQSFPYQSRAFPELSERGAYCSKPWCVYTPEFIATVIREAQLRGIRVIPEFDLPGHSKAIGASHPEFLTTCGDNQEPMEPLDVTKPEVQDFIHQLYNEIVALFPDDWIHVGGDEVPVECWAANPAIQQWMRNHNMTNANELLQYFEISLITYMTDALHKTPIVWQEVFDSANALHLHLPPQTIVDVWKGDYASTIDKATRQGLSVILSSCWYLDNVDATAHDYYKCNPRSGFNATKDDDDDDEAQQQQMQLVVGGHASMWGEMVDETNFMSRVWPRAAVTAEKLWTGSSNTSTAEANYPQRLEKFRCYMKLHGIAVSPPFGPGTCEVHLHNNNSNTSMGHPLSSTPSSNNITVQTSTALRGLKGTNKQG